MKVLDLQCSSSHRFEGWFASVDDFESQLTRALVACPVCGATGISRLPSAPRLNLSNPSAPAGDDGNGSARHDAPRPPCAPPELAQAMRALRAVLEKTEDVGERFVEEARRIHYDEAPARSIRGVATPDDARALIEEGIDVLPLPVPAALKGTLQ